MAFDLLPSLKAGNMRAVICVRVSRKWEYRGGTDDGPIQHVDLVLIDERGNSMYGEIPAAEVETKSPLLKENDIYVISRFRVSNAKRSFRPVAAQFMVEFTFHTQVSTAREEMPTFPLYAHRLTPIDDLKPRAGDTADFVDVIGLLTEVLETYTVHLPNKSRPTLTRHIILRDQNYSEIKISLWGERASAFAIPQDLTETEGKPIVILFLGGLMKRYQDNYYLSANAAARWYFNPQILQARHLYNGHQDQRVDVKRVAAPCQVATQRCAPSQLDAKTLSDLNAMDPYDYKDDGYRCTVTIDRLVPNTSWWFASCTRCSKSCSPDGTGYKCSSCSSTSFRFKYKISFMALDDTAEAEMICFGDTARQIVGKLVQQLLRTNTSASQLPANISRIVGRRFTFAIALTQQSNYREKKTYQVNSVVTAHGQHEPAPSVAQPYIPRSPAMPSTSRATDETLSTLITTQSAPLSPPEIEVEHSSALTDHTLPPKLAGAATPSSKPWSVTPTSQAPPPELADAVTPSSKLLDKSTKGERSSARKRLIYEGCDDEVPLGSSDKESAGDDHANLELAKSGVPIADGPTSDAVSGDKKRPCSARVAGQRAG